jgi:hypothetical protein
VHLFPSHAFYEDFNTDKPAVVTVIIVVIFFCISILFCLYDCAVHKRQRQVLAIAARSEKILSILYPKTIRDRLFGNHDDDAHEEAPAAETKRSTTKRNKKLAKKHQQQGAKSQLKTYLKEDDASTDKKKGAGATVGVDMYESKPIADLFPSTTVLFADIAGFTAWSSVREPSQVFILLETVFRAFDGIAKRRRVFKVETVGDCYVAVTGLPEPRKVSTCNEDGKLGNVLFA